MGNCLSDHLLPRLEELKRFNSKIFAGIVMTYIVFEIKVKLKTLCVLNFETFVTFQTSIAQSSVR